MSALQSNLYNCFISNQKSVIQIKLYNLASAQNLKEALVLIAHSGLSGKFYNIRSDVISIRMALKHCHGLNIENSALARLESERLGNLEMTRKVRFLLFVVRSSSSLHCPIVQPPAWCWWQLPAVKTSLFQFMLFDDLSDHW